MAKGLTYKQAGVNISEADQFIKKIKPHVKSTHRTGMLGSIGGFGGFFRMQKKLKKPVIVAATDGVGTKLLIAKEQKRFDTVGIDLVAMCVNDIIACGAEPLIFLDYYATGKLKAGEASRIVKGIATGCRDAGCGILGGETAELPGLYAKGDYDLAGFCVGLVEENKIITGVQAKRGDLVLGMHSTGLHSNGFSLARKVFTKRELRGKWGKILLAPTRIYAKAVMELAGKGLVAAIANITGGGFYDNINRSLPKNLNVVVFKDAWKVPQIFNEIQKRGKINEREMYHTFNMGIGMTLIAGPRKVDRVQNVLRKHKIRSSVIGVVTGGKNEVIIKP